MLNWITEGGFRKARKLAWEIACLVQPVVGFCVFSSGNHSKNGLLMAHRVQYTSLQKRQALEGKDASSISPSNLRRWQSQGVPDIPPSRYRADGAGRHTELKDDEEKLIKQIVMSGRRAGEVVSTADIVQIAERLFKESHPKLLFSPHWATSLAHRQGLALRTAHEHSTANEASVELYCQRGW